MNQEKHERSTTDLVRAAVSGWLGTALEFMDFQLYSLGAALVFHEIFFPEQSAAMALILAMGTYGAGYIARIVGAFIFGKMGDSIGRKKVLFITITMMGICTTLIGVLPTYAQIGIFAPILLVTLRIVQGLGAGAEISGAGTMLAEYAPKGKRGIISSLVAMGTNCGTLSATAIWAVMFFALDREELLAWGWRIPFWLSAVMLIVGLFIRLHTEETLDFQKQKTTNNKEKSVPPLIELFKKHPRNILLALGARLAESVSSNIINAFGIVYISSQLALSRDIPLTGMLIASAIGIFSCPLVGWLSDRIGQKSLYLSGAGFCVLFAFPFFLLLDSKSTLIIWCSMILGYNLGPTMMFAVQPTLFTRMFGTKVRYTGLSFAYQFSAILGGLSPLIASSLLALGGGKPWYVALFLFAVSVLSFVCVWLIEPTDEQETASYRYIREQSHEN